MHFDNYNLRGASNPVSLQAEKKFPYYATFVIWIQIFNATGDTCSKRATCNHHAKREVQGAKLEQLALYRTVSLKATIAECRSQLFHVDPTKEPFSDSQVHRAENLLGLRRMADSTTANLAFLLVNQRSANSIGHCPHRLA
jgi:hypothetical protein